MEARKLGGMNHLSIILGGIFWNSAVLTISVYARWALIARSNKATFSAFFTTERRQSVIHKSVGGKRVFDSMNENRRSNLDISELQTAITTNCNYY